MLCGAARTCGCYLGTVAATTGTITGSLPTITVAGTGTQVSPWVMTLDSAWSQKVADALIPTPWTNMTLINGYANYGGYALASYRKIGDMVYVRGLIQRGGASAGVTCFVMPVGFRPPASLLVPADHNSLTHGRIDVYSTGEIMPHYVAGDAGYYSLSMIKFSVT